MRDFEVDDKPSDLVDSIGKGHFQCGVEIDGPFDKGERQPDLELYRRSIHLPLQIK